MSTSAISASGVDLTSLSGNGNGATTTANNEAAADRFLKLLVAQMKNQDPLNPMDNAQVTSQMAQINTVNGIEKLNGSVQQLSGQFVQMQALQGAALVGRDVIVQGNVLAIEDGIGVGGFELSSPADQVRLEVLSPSGQVVDTLALGASGAGRHGFNWPAGTADAASGLRFRVVAMNGAATLPSTTLMRDRVNAVSANGSSLTLELAQSGSVAYEQIKAFN